MTRARLARIRTTSSPVLSALYRGDREEAERLAQDRDLDLFEAAALGRPESVAAASSNEIVALLLERGADVDATQRGGHTPLHSAAANENHELVTLPIEAGAEPARRTHAGETAASLAAERGHPEIARRLDEGASI